MIKFHHPTGNPSNSNHVGNTNKKDSTVAHGTCPFCGISSGFSQIGTSYRSKVHDNMIALRCDTCSSVFGSAINEKEIFPKPPEEGLSDLPTLIGDYYDEGLRCIRANAPNGAAALFRKVIHAVCLEYDIAEVDDNSSIYSMINALADEGHITETLRKSLLAVKDVGNDGAHINENDPSLEQARNLKNIVDGVLTATVVAKQRVEYARKEHPNPHQE